MVFRNFIYTKDDEDLMFLPKEPSSGFGPGSTSVSVNTEPLKANKEPDIQPVEVTADSRGTPKPELFVVHLGSVAARIKDSKYKTRGGRQGPLLRGSLLLGLPPLVLLVPKLLPRRMMLPSYQFLMMMRVYFQSLTCSVPSLPEESTNMFVFMSLFFLLGLPDVLELKDANACHLKISAITPPAWKNHLDNHIDLELLDLHDRCYARQAVVDNVVNRRSRELLQVIEKLRGECDVMRSRERARDEECEGLRVKCEAAMTDFEKNPAVVALREKISALSTEAKEHKLSLDRMMLESQKWAGYQQSLSTLESKVTALETEKARLEAVEVSLWKEVYELKQDRRVVVSKVVPYLAMELVHSDDMGSLVGKLVSSTIVYGRCRAFEQVAGMKEPFDLSKVKGYRSSYKKDHTQASNDLATATFHWLDEFVADPSALIEALLSKKPPTLQRPTPLRTQVPLVSSQRATSASVLASNLMSPPADASVLKPQSSPPQ
ncbi:hypothetical protein Tco_0986248 [Tanacetum coccineum]